MKFGINQSISQTITQLSCIQLETPSSRLWNFWWIKTYTTFNPSSDSDKVKVTVTCSHYHIRTADAGLLKIDRCWASSPVLDNKLFIFVESVHLQD